MDPDAPTPVATARARGQLRETARPELDLPRDLIRDDPTFPTRLHRVAAELAALPADRWGAPRVVESSTSAWRTEIHDGSRLPVESLVRGDLSPFDAPVAVALVCRALEAWRQAPASARRALLTTLELGIDWLGRARIGAVLSPRVRNHVVTHAEVLEFLEREPSQERAEVLAWAEQLHQLLTGRFAFPVQKPTPDRPPFSRLDRARLDKLPATLRDTIVAALDTDPAKRPASTTELLGRLQPFRASPGLADVEVSQRLNARAPERRAVLLRRVLELSVVDEPLPHHLEGRVLDPETREEGYLVLRDWMLSEGWLRGELAALPNRRSVGQSDYDTLMLTWKQGWVQCARATYDVGLRRFLELVKGSSFRFLERLELPGDVDLSADVVSVLVDARLRALRTVAAPGPIDPRLLERLRTMPQFERWELVPKIVHPPPPEPTSTDRT